jgi:hypothetical protein
VSRLVRCLPYLPTMKTMSIPLFQVDAFTDRAFAGSPDAVCLSRVAILPHRVQAGQRSAGEVPPLGWEWRSAIR